MSELVTFEDVSESMWLRMKEIGMKEHGTNYDPPDTHRGVARTFTPLGNVEIEFVYDPEARRLQYRLQSKPFLVASSMIWHGVQATVDRCRSA
jgi:hypothetical protein